MPDKIDAGASAASGTLSTPAELGTRRRGSTLPQHRSARMTKARGHCHPSMWKREPPATPLHRRLPPIHPARRAGFIERRTGSSGRVILLGVIVIAVVVIAAAWLTR